MNRITVSLFNMNDQRKSLPLFVLLGIFLLPETAFGNKCDCCPCPCKCECETKQVTTTAPAGCFNVCLNLGLIIDGSSSVSPQSWGDILTFLQALSSQFTIGFSATTMGMVQFASRAVQEFDFKDSANANNEDLANMFASRTQLGGSTNLAEGIELFLNTTWPTRRTFLPPGCTNLNNAVIIITDGIPGIRPLSLLSSYADLAREFDEHRYGVAVGNAAVSVLALAIGSEARVHNITDYSGLLDILNLLVTDICDGVGSSENAAPIGPMPLTKCHCCCPPPVPVKFSVSPWTPSCGDEYTSSSTGTSSLYMSTQ